MASAPVDLAPLLNPPPMRHRLSVHKEVAAERNAAFVDGICHAIDVLAATEGEAAADRLLGLLFVPAERGGA